MDSGNVINIKGITNDSIHSYGTTYVTLNMNTDSVTHEFHIVPDDFNVDCDGIIGKDFLAAYKCRIDYSDMSFRIQSGRCANIFKISDSPDGNFITIPPRCEVVRQFKINASKECVIDQITIAPGVYTSRTIVQPKNAFIRVINTTDKPQRVSRTIENFELLDEYHCYQAIDNLKNEVRTAKLRELISKNVPAQYRRNLLDLVEEFTDIFALPEDKMSINNFYTQRLRISDDTPTYIRNYRTPQTSRAEIRGQVNRLLENELIEPCASNYNSPLILVPKKSLDGTRKWRMCLDYRSVNGKLIADKYPLPRIDDILDNLGRSVLFSVMDLFNGFHQIPLDEASRDITAFSTEQGSFRWKVLPFGLNVSPNSFSRMMNLAFSGLPADGLFVYIDDIIVLGKSERDHLNNLRETFLRCRERNLKVNPTKCSFFKTEVLFLGHLCSSDGIRPDPSKFSTIENYPIPRDSDAVRRFVALANYYRKFIPNFSTISIPLNRLTKKNAPFVWLKEQELAFNQIKVILGNPQMLAYPDFSQQFTLTVDASRAGCGAVLSQSNRPIAFASKSFNRAESNKSTIEQELIAMHWSIKHFRHYLYGTHFIVQSDHKPLVYLYNLKDPSSKLTRLRLELSEYNFTVEHIKGKSNVVADALSRIHIDDIRTSATRDTDFQNLNILMTTRSMSRRKNLAEINHGKPTRASEVEEELNVMHAVSREDVKGIPIIHTHLVDGTRAPKQFIISVHQKYKSTYEMGNFKVTFIQETLFAQQLLSQLQKLADKCAIQKMKIFTNESIFKIISINTFKDLGNENKDENGNEILKNLKIRLANPIKVVTDQNEQQKLIQIYHGDKLNGGHFGVEKMLNKLRSKYTWKSMNRQVRNYVEICIECQKNKPKIKVVEPLVLTDTPQKPFDKISIDTIGPFRTSANENKYALTMLCELSKYLIIAPMANKEANTIARAIFQNLILIHGPVGTIVSDQGTEFVNSIMKELCSNLKIEHRVSTAYHHETVGSVERNHRFFNEYLRSYLSDDDDWEECLRYFAYCYNTSHHSSFDYKFTPFELVYGRENRVIEYLQSNRVDPIYNIDHFAKEAKYRLQATAIAARNLLEKNKANVKIRHDAHKSNPIKLRINDKVMVRDGARHKHDAIFKGPYLVIAIDEPNITIQDEKSKKTRTVHKNNVNIYKE